MMTEQISSRSIIPVGTVLNRLTVVSFEGKDKQGNRIYKCLCSCGIYSVVRGFSLRDGTTKSCGCLQKEAHVKTHGLTGSPEHVVWRGMWSRCRSTGAKAYEKYKERTPVEAWKDFAVFLNDMGPKPDPSSTLERVDNSKGYGPDNCVWASREAQAYNRDNTLRVEYRGELIPIGLLAKRFSLSPARLKYRIKAGWTAEEAVSLPAFAKYTPRKSK